MLIYTDRSRWELGLKFCQRARFLKYDLGGTGIVPMYEGDDLSIGRLTHRYCAAILTMYENGGIPTREQVREALDAVNAEQEDQEGIGVPHAPSIQHQAMALAWAFYRCFQPTGVVLHVEHEFTRVLECDCGLAGIGEPELHDQRGCNGVVLMTRPDFIIAADQTRASMEIFDIKTSAYDPDFGEEHILQMALEALGIEGIYGTQSISGYRIVTLKKGRKETDRTTGQKYTGGRLNVAYWKDADPPFHTAELSPEWKRGYTRVNVWETLGADLNDGCSSAAERWVMDVLDEATVREHVLVSPMFQRPTFMVNKLEKQLVWAEREWFSRRVQCRSGDDIDRLFPCSWDCRPYNRDCEYKPICFEHPGVYRGPSGFPQLIQVNSGHYARRVPNHEIERKLLGGGEEESK